MLDERYLSQFPALRSRLVRAAARMLGGTADAEDVVQDTYLRALEAADKPAPDSAQAWLTTVMQNLAVDRLRRDRWMQWWLKDAEGLSPQAPSAETEAAQAQEADHALRLLAERLSRTDAAAVLLREVFELSYSEIAKVSGKTEAGCRQQLHRALMRLRGREAPSSGRTQDDPETEAALQLYRQSLLNRDANVLLAMLCQPATRAVVRSAAAGTTAAPNAVCQVTHVGGQLGLVLTLGNQFVCMLPLGTRYVHEDASV
ncbi:MULTISPECIES: sigma-70 family RNA polymerase sigma factor [Variovorax]|jgi:RNA polymerase sigma factor (sigma-70 family)|uniref:sigma-70 family RNA polymerase sigma factor n=1 Tax=Variovorax TaxID=34072 RepID=UPI00086926A5|nr:MULTISPECIES: sigma-70 family RNA polymerase sigma factor [Variovorax]MBN8754537.1 sigma-70 family RNA polymerase sigma factor [Variovorax sp.]ODU17576.1 MAG: RNA polymerase subunit sigma-24 [Variovorax sp. SCN 67-85]ODV24261.1 MAG: RNA polymerase subunit sigma-24 [Variovorax sp. SCN 67-20]OJZ04137.1 MAG: RNA polymerase subunit sigma-24 [Variovorax sp. 67-131]UKI09984.1 sigma-70 family RNA polymerase sigma factor [Variovorax paradoxus]